MASYEDIDKFIDLIKDDSKKIKYFEERFYHLTTNYLEAVQDEWKSAIESVILDISEKSQLEIFTKLINVDIKIICQKMDKFIFLIDTLECIILKNKDDYVYYFDGIEIDITQYVPNDKAINKLQLFNDKHGIDNYYLIWDAFVCMCVNLAQYRLNWNFNAKLP